MEKAYARRPIALPLRSSRRCAYDSPPVHPFRFGIQVHAAPSRMSEWRDLARRVEELGYSTVFVPDHFDEQYGPLVALSVAAEATTRLKVGSLVFDNDYRHPLVLAKECASLDLASEGRLEVGLGAGWLRSDYEQSGIAYDPPGVRVERLAEAIEIVTALWRHERVDFEGAHYRLSGARGLPRPFSEGGPRLIVGGGGRRVLELAARHADVVGVNTSLRAGEVGPEAVAAAKAERYAERIAWVREAAGERLGEIELQSLVFFAEIGRPQEVVADELAAVVGFAPQDIIASPIGLFGTEDEIVDTLRQRRERWGFSYWVLHEAEIETFAPVVARLSGS